MIFVPVAQSVVRDERASDMMEMMLVLAVATILCIRAFLSITGYPQLGGGGLHIAHMLWGGLGMLVSIALLLSFWSPAMRQVAAAIGGIGFGFFIDELGKFITSDNDYFFQPTIALIYVIFILLFLAVRAIGSRPLTAVEIATNQKIVAVMSAAGETSRVHRIYEQIDDWLRKTYARLISTRWFAPALSAGFIVVAVSDVVSTIALIAGKEASSGLDMHIPVVEQVASTVSAAFIVLGVLLAATSVLAVAMGL